MSNPNIASRFDEVYNSTNKAVLALITAKCGRTSDINDIYQDTYMELYQLLLKRGADYVTNERALVLRIAKRKIARYYSLKERLRLFVSMTATDEDGREVDLLDFEAEAFSANSFLTDSFLTEDFTEKQALLDTARQLIQSKPEAVQKVFYLMYDVGLSIPEIAAALSMSESNVKNKLYRTLKELRGMLEISSDN